MPFLVTCQHFLQWFVKYIILDCTCSTTNGHRQALNCSKVWGPQFCNFNGHVLFFWNDQLPIIFSSDLNMCSHPMRPCPLHGKFVWVVCAESECHTMLGIFIRCWLLSLWGQDLFASFCRLSGCHWSWLGTGSQLQGTCRSWSKEGPAGTCFPLPIPVFRSRWSRQRTRWYDLSTELALRCSWGKTWKDTSTQTYPECLLHILL